MRVTSRGYGFVKAAEGEYFIPQSKMGGSFDGDVVELAPISTQKDARKNGAQSPDKKQSARVVRVIDRAHDTLIGRYELAEPFGIVIPEDPKIPYDIFTMRKDSPHVNHGDLVRVRLTAYPSRNSAATGVVEEVLGSEGEERLDIDLVVAKYKLATAFSAGACREAGQAVVDVEGALQEGYRDLRERCVFTIDPSDARDFDDALSLEQQEAGWRLGIHIADVSHYVLWGSSIDLDARRRATSAYLVDRVIPMLPEELSAHICSLVPGEPRRALSLDLFLDEDFGLRRFEAYTSLISSSRRFTYDEAQDILDGRLDVAGGYSDRLRALSRFAQKRRSLREAAGGMDFETVEAKVLLDESGKPREVVLRSKTEATMLVEEAMIAANSAVAGYLDARGFPSIYRVHEAPSSDALAELVPIIKEFPYLADINLPGFAAGSPYELQKVLAGISGKPEAELLTSLLLRAMKRARYLPQCEPHYGLAEEAYTHFTSPIRRYPDLVVHRMLKAQLFGKGGTFEGQVHALSGLAEHSSEMERVAEAAARESQEVKLVEYHARSIGEEFDAVVSGVASYGIFVQLPTTAEGLVSIKDLGEEYFSYDARRHILAGEESGRIFRLGQRIRVVLVAASPRERRLDFRLSGPRQKT